VAGDDDARRCVVIVAGILLSAVGDELVIAHPTEELPDAELAAVVSGPALYLLAHVALRLRMTGTIGGRRLAGALACLAIGAIGSFASALVVAGLLLAVLVAVIAGDQVAAARRRAPGRAVAARTAGDQRAASVTAAAARLTLPALNRALLARQGLLDRLDAPLVEAVGALQAQHWPALPVALWSRVRGFAPADLPGALERGELVVGTLLRNTLHLVSAREHPA
jgi:Winged helix DNA-binding domain/Bacterial low temperature requirement A protein (LtrA)